jgi:hypothetical protein
MTIKYICDGCGRDSKGQFNGINMFMPDEWFSKNTDDGVIHACCRECIEKVNNKRGENTLVLPI